MFVALGWINDFLPSLSAYVYATSVRCCCCGLSVECVEIVFLMGGYAGNYLFKIFLIVESSVFFLQIAWHTAGAKARPIYNKAVQLAYPLVSTRTAH